MTARLEAVNAKLVEVEQGQPADVVDKKTVGDIAAKQASVEQGQQSVAAALARLEQLVTQSLEAGNQQAAALQHHGRRCAQPHGGDRRAAARAAGDEGRAGGQAKANQEQATALSDTAAQLQAIRGELQDKVRARAPSSQQQLAEVTSRG